MNKRLKSRIVLILTIILVLFISVLLVQNHVAKQDIKIDTYARLLLEQKNLISSLREENRDLRTAIEYKTSTVPVSEASQVEEEEKEVTIEEPDFTTVGAMTVGAVLSSVLKRVGGRLIFN